MVMSGVSSVQLAGRNCNDHHSQGEWSFPTYEAQTMKCGAVWYCVVCGPVVTENFKGETEERNVDCEE